MAKRKDAAGTPSEELAPVEMKSSGEGAASAEPSKSEPAEPAKVEPRIDPPTAELLVSDLPVVESPKLADPAPSIPAMDHATRPKDAPIPQNAAQKSTARGSRFALLAASVAIAAGVGAMAGAVAVSALTASPAAPASAANAGNDSRALQASIAQLRTELSALRTSVEAGTKVTNGQFGKVSERFDRLERAQAEPSAKIGKAVEALDRLEKRADIAPPKDKDITGSVTAPAATPASATSPTPPFVEGWVVRDVYRGAAIIQGRRFGMMEVEPGDSIPGVGRVEAIRKQEGRWVVVTSKGLIGPALLTR
jgi:hypothetical protein